MHSAKHIILRLYTNKIKRNILYREAVSFFAIAFAFLNKFSIVPSIAPKPAAIMFYLKT